MGVPQVIHCFRLMHFRDPPCMETPKSCCFPGAKHPGHAIGNSRPKAFGSNVERITLQDNFPASLGRRCMMTAAGFGAAISPLDPIAIPQNDVPVDIMSSSNMFKLWSLTHSRSGLGFSLKLWSKTVRSIAEQHPTIIVR